MFNCTGSLDECDCDCHRHEGVKHCMPCCYPCPHCGRNISIGWHKAHVEGCEQEQKENNEKIEKLILSPKQRREANEIAKGLKKKKD